MGQQDVETMSLNCRFQHHAMIAHPNFFPERFLKFAGKNETPFLNILTGMNIANESTPTTIMGYGTGEFLIRTFFVEKQLCLIEK